VNSTLRFWIISCVAMAVFLVAATFALGQWNLHQFSNFVGDRLVLLNELRRGALKQYFATAEAELLFWSTSPEILTSQKRLNEIWSDGGIVAAKARENYIDNNPNPQGFFRNLDDAGDDSIYSELHGSLHPRAKLFVTERGYYDFFLIGPDGDVMYSVEKESDFGTNLSWGQWSDTGLAEVFEQARRAPEPGFVAVSDMQPYGPSGGAAAMFMGTAVHDEDGNFLGVIAFQLPTDRIVSIMNYTSGMGETGETYLVGEDLLMRSNSRFSKESTILTQAVDTPTVHRALEGGEGMELVNDYRDVEVMSVYSPFKVGEANWAVMAEIDREEVVHAAARNRPAMYGVLMFFYGLSLWSLWYWRSRQLPDFDGGEQMAFDLPDGDGPGLAS
jgi:methyl-accepting chemotaxis protein